MEIYRYGEEENMVCYTILIIEDDGEKRISTVGLNTVTEQIAYEHHCKTGIVRLVYGGGSSVPFKDENGNLHKRWVKISG